MNDPTRREAIRLIAAGCATLASAAAVRGAEPTSMPTTRPKVIARPIPSSGVRLPVIGLGTYQTFDVSKDPFERAPLEAVLSAFVDRGGSVVDSSPMYDRAEEVVGELMIKLGLRDRLFVATKVWTRGKAEGITQMRTSMNRLHADPIDLMQVHNLLDVDEHLATLDEWKAAGRVKHIGVTHYTARGAAEIVTLLNKRMVDVVQVNYSVAERDAETKLLPLCRDKGVAVIANRPFAGGETLKRLADRALPAVAKDLDCATWSELLLKFVVGHPAVTCAIPATAKLEHLHSNMNAGAGPMPDEKQRNAIAVAANA